MKNLNEAYEHTMRVIDSLFKQGIEVLIQQPRIIRESENPNNLNVVKKYDRSDRLNWILWRNVQFKVKNEEESKKVSFARMYLGVNGCSFDTGCGLGSMDWEIDWSFKFNDKEEKTDRVYFDEIMEKFSIGSGFDIN